MVKKVLCVLLIALMQVPYFALAGPSAAGAQAVPRNGPADPGRAVRAPISESVIGGLRSLGFDVDVASGLSQTEGGATVWVFGVRAAGRRGPSPQPGASRVPIGVMMLERDGTVESVHTMWSAPGRTGPTIEWEATVPARPSCSIRFHVEPAAGGDPSTVSMAVVDRATGIVTDLATFPAGPGHRNEDIRFSASATQDFKDCFWQCLKRSNILLSAGQFAFLAGCIGAAGVASLVSGGAAVPAVIPVIWGCVAYIGGFILVARIGTIAGCAFACLSC